MSLLADEVEPRFVWKRNAGTRFEPRLPSYRINRLAREGKITPLRFGVRTYVDVRELDAAVLNSPISVKGGSHV